jgi:hypothetical protein
LRPRAGQTYFWIAENEAMIAMWTVDVKVEVEC